METMKGGKLSFMILFGIGLLLGACSTVLSNEATPAGSSENRVEASNGERIYFTASSDRSGQITYTGGPRFGGGMMGSYLTCASCHGPEGRGGVHRMHMQVMDAPDIRYQALSSELDEHGGEDHGAEDDEYDLDDFRLAVIEGKHPNGEELSRDMPRWRMSEENLQDLFAFIQSLP